MDQAAPALVVASALKPRLARYRALPASHGLGLTKQPDWCSCRKAVLFSSVVVMRPTIGGGLRQSPAFAVRSRVLDERPAAHEPVRDLAEPDERQFALLLVGQPEVGAGGCAQHCNGVATAGYAGRQDQVAREGSRVAPPRSEEHT